MTEATARTADDARDPAASETAASERVRDAARAHAREAAGGDPDVPAYDLIELFFFAYRDFVSDPDRILDDYGFGRAHHRVLHFVSRNPGLTIAELLEILRITKQSLNRVLKELIEKGFVEARPGTTDRRQRLLFPTRDGGALALRLARLQTGRVGRALADTPPEGRAAVVDFLIAMIDPDGRAAVTRRVGGPEGGPDAGGNGGSGGAT